ncbi:MAG: cellulose binding domain-containing protein [Synechococcus sp.]|nr:cellulose binding domain-containing protein [Synechococcus sp.]
MASTTVSPLAVTVGGNLWWGGMSGELTITNTTSTTLEGWSLEFRTPVRQFQGWSMESAVVDNGDGTATVTLRNAPWNATLRPGESLTLSFNALSPEGTPSSGPLTADLLFAGDAAAPLEPAPVVPVPAEPVPVEPVPVVPAPVDPLPPTGEAPPPAPPAEGDLWGSQAFAPYVDMGLYPVPDLDGLARRYGVGLLNLGFLQATPSGRLGWAGLDALALGSDHEQARAIQGEITALRAAGGDVMVSLGGAAGQSLAQAYQQRGLGAEVLAQAYAEAADTLGLRRLDFDIEGAALADRASLQLQSEAIARLQSLRPELGVWFTLPVLPQGLTREGLEAVELALQAGVRLAGVNVMAMDYGDSAAPPSLKTMGAYAIDAAEATHAQLVTLFAAHGQGFGWGQMGVTPMIGVNDVTSEVFTLADAELLENFARQRGLGLLSMWSLGRDNPGPLGQVTATHSGLAEASGSFATLWGDYGSDPVAISAGGGGSASGGSGSDPITGGNTGTTTGSGGTLVERVVGGSTTALQAMDGVAERFQLSYAWGRQLQITGFDPLQDRLDLRGFWQEGQGATVVAVSGGSRLELPFNQQQVLLPGVTPEQLGGGALEIWWG